MSAINEGTRDAWQRIADDLSLTRPYPGREVHVSGGRKHKGKRGRVLTHMISKFTHAYRYGSDASHHMRDMEGRSGWVCQIQPMDGPRFWVNAEHLTVFQVGKFECSGCGLPDPFCECSSAFAHEGGRP